MRVLTNVCGCVVCDMGVCVGVCGSAFFCVLAPHISDLFFILFVLIAVAAISCLYHTVPQALVALYFVAATV